MNDENQNINSTVQNPSLNESTRESAESEKNLAGQRVKKILDRLGNDVDDDDATIMSETSLENDQVSGERSEVSDNNAEEKPMSNHRNLKGLKNNSRYGEFRTRQNRKTQTASAKKIPKNAYNDDDDTSSRDTLLSGITRQNTPLWKNLQTNQQSEEFRGNMALPLSHQSHPVPQPPSITQHPHNYPYPKRSQQCPATCQQISRVPLQCSYSQDKRNGESINVPPCIATLLKKLRVTKSQPESNLKHGDLYQIKVEHKQDGCCPPQQLLFELVDNPVLKDEQKSEASLLLQGDNIDKHQENIDYNANRTAEQNVREFYDQDKSNGDKTASISRLTEEDTRKHRVELYYFDHGNAGYFRTTDRPPLLITERCIDKTDAYITRFWAEVFGTIHVPIAFVTVFLLQFFRFILCSIIRPLIIGIIQMTSDYFFKPLLAILFNSIIQPLLILLYNIARSVRDCCEPISKAIGCFIREFSVPIRAFRLAEVNINNRQSEV